MRSVTDWFHPQWLAVSILILLLCACRCAPDPHAHFHGAVEVNPLMEPLVQRDRP